MRRFFTGVVSAFVATAIAAPISFGSASATTQPVPKATGGVAMVPVLPGPTATTYLRYMSFSAFDQTPAKGSVSYTNFSYPEPAGVHTGVWAPPLTLNNIVGGQFQLGFTAYGHTYWHTVTLNSVTALSTSSIVFAGTGTFNDDPTNPAFFSVVTGTVVGSMLSMTFNYVPGPNEQAAPLILLSASLATANDGSVTDGAITLPPNSTVPPGTTWSVPVGSFLEVWSFTAPVTSASVNSSAGTASFTFDLPPVFNAANGGGNPSIPTLVTDHGTPATASSGDSLTLQGVPQVLLSGNIVVH